MTTEKIVLFGIEDIRAVRIVCQSCKSEIVCPMARTEKRIPTECPECNDEWQKMQAKQIACQKRASLMKELFACRNDDSPVELKFEIADI